MLIAWNNLQWAQPCEILGKGNKYIFIHWNQKIFCLGGAPWKLLHKDMFKAVISPTLVLICHSRRQDSGEPCGKGFNDQVNLKKFITLDVRNLQQTLRKSTAQKPIYICLTQNFPNYFPMKISLHKIPVNMSHNQHSAPHIFEAPHLEKLSQDSLERQASLPGFLNHAFYHIWGKCQIPSQLIQQLWGRY